VATFSATNENKQPMKTLLALIALSGSAYGAPPESFWRALHQVESGGRHGRILGDYVNGQPQALGPLQLHRGFHRDSNVPGPFERVADLSYARRVATAYYRRYAPEAWERGDVVVLARIHQGGPRGHHKAATLAYSRKVLAAMGGKR
jgi:hypothetical protein